jgi:hypothetical protein
MVVEGLPAGDEIEIRLEFGIKRPE